MVRWFLGLGLLWCFVAGLWWSDPAYGASGTMDQLQQWQQSIQDRREQLVQQKQRLADLEQGALGYLKILEDHIEVTDTHLQDYQRQINEADRQLAQLTKDLAIAQTRYAPKLQATVARLRILQRQGGINQESWSLLIDSDNANTFFERQERLKRLYTRDRQTLGILKQEADAIRQQQFIIENTKNQIALIQQRLLLQKAQFNAQSLEQQQLVGRLSTDRQAIDAAETQLEKDSQNLEILIRQRLGNQTPIPNRYQGGGRFQRPSVASISSPYGWRIHPITRRRRLHTGIDFAGNYGSSITAAEAGNIIFAGWYGGYGNTVIVDHGKGITTLYGHTSRIVVKEGQNVERGQAIAAVGSTGFSTGPHLHFEVRENGRPVDPRPYLFP